MAADVKYLLLRWVGLWLNAGENHGRECIFESEEAALSWARDEFPDAVVEVVPVEWPKPHAAGLRHHGAVTDPAE